MGQAASAKNGGDYSEKPTAVHKALSKAYDGLVFIKNMTPVTPIE